MKEAFLIDPYGRTRRIKEEDDYSILCHVGYRISHELLKHDWKVTYWIWKDKEWQEVTRVEYYPKETNPA